MERGHFLLRLAQGHRGIECLGHGLVPDVTCQPKVRGVTRIVTFGAVASRFTAIAGGSRYGTATEVDECGELAKQIRSLRLQLGERVRHSASISKRISTLRITPQKKKPAFRPLQRRAPARRHPFCTTPYRVLFFFKSQSTLNGRSAA